MSEFSTVYHDSYRVTRSATAIRIDVLDYHAEPLFLDSAQLLQLGLRIERPTRFSSEIGDYRLTVDRAGMRVDVLEYHAEALVLDAAWLEVVGLISVGRGQGSAEGLRGRGSGRRKPTASSIPPRVRVAARRIV
jgi:hypothetical protein